MSNLQTALDLARYGYYVHPLKPGDKIPLAEHGYNDATRDEDQIREWWRETPAANVGFSLDKTGLVDISDDCPEWAARFAAKGLPDTTRYDSGAGAHRLYRLPKGGPVARACVSKQYDIMSQGNAVAPGSIHPSGRTYTARTPILPVEDLPLAPDWAIELLQSHVKATRKEHTPADWAELPSGATLAHSRRFQALCKANAQLRAVCAGEAVTLTIKNNAKDNSPSIQRAVFVNQLLRAKYPHNEIRALALHFSGVLESKPKWFKTDIDNLLRPVDQDGYTPKDYAPESTGVLLTDVAPRGGRHYEITAAELLDRYHEHAGCGPSGIVLDWTVNDAADRLGVSTGTIKRREAELTAAGHIRRDYGRVILLPAQLTIGSQRIDMPQTAAIVERVLAAIFPNFIPIEDAPLEHAIGSQSDLPQPDAPNVPENAVCITDHAPEEITHSSTEPPSPGWRLTCDRRGMWALRGPAGECSWYGSEGAARDALAVKTAPDADDWASAWREADEILATWTVTPRWQRVARSHQQALGLGLGPPG